MGGWGEVRDGRGEKCHASVAREASRDCTKESRGVHTTSKISKFVHIHLMFVSMD